MRLIPERPPPFWPRFSDSRTGARGTAVTARIGLFLGPAFAICFLTGLLSHYQYGPYGFLPEPSAPAWGYRVTQGVHVITGISLIPLLLVKLWSVFPRLFAWPPVRGVVHGIERLTVALLISSAIIEVLTGFFDAANWYPWPWQFVNVHFWLAWVVAGSILLHVSVQLPAIRRGLSEPVAPNEETRTSGGISRRGVILAAFAGSGALLITTIGQTVTPLQKLAILAIRRPDQAPEKIPINRTAAQAEVTAKAMSASYRLEFKGPNPWSVDVAGLEALSTVTERYPLACVEGWSAAGSWTGPRLLDLVEKLGGNSRSRVRIRSLEKNGAYQVSVVEGPQLQRALLATHLDGQRLSVDHGYPVRLIAPNRAGVLNTKWIGSVELL